MNKLSELIELKAQIRTQESQLDSIMADAILEALDIIDNLDINNQVVFRDKIGKIVLIYRKRFVPVKQSKELSKIDELIIANKTILANSNRQKLNEIESLIEYLISEIKTLEKERDAILTNSLIISLKSEFIKVQEQESYLEPTLSIYLN